MKTVSFMLHLVASTRWNILFSTELLVAFLVCITFYWGPWSLSFYLQDSDLVLWPTTHSKIKCFELIIHSIYFWGFWDYIIIILNICNSKLCWAGLKTSHVLFVVRTRYLNIIYSKSKTQLLQNQLSTFVISKQRYEVQKFTHFTEIHSNGHENYRFSLHRSWISALRSYHSVINWNLSWSNFDKTWM